MLGLFIFQVMHTVLGFASFQLLLVRTSRYVSITTPSVQCRFITAQINCSNVLTLYLSLIHIQMCIRDRGTYKGWKRRGIKKGGKGTVCEEMIKGRPRTRWQNNIRNLQKSCWVSLVGSQCFRIETFGERLATVALSYYKHKNEN